MCSLRGGQIASSPRQHKVPGKSGSLTTEPSGWRTPSFTITDTPRPGRIISSTNTLARLGFITGHANVSRPNGGEQQTGDGRKDRRNYEPQRPGSC